MTRLIRDDSRLRVRVCCGMHCQGRKLLQAFEDAVLLAGLSGQVEVTSAHCLGECADGPCVRIGQARFYHVAADDVDALLREEILPQL